MKNLTQINKKLLLAVAVSAAASQAGAFNMQLDSAYTFNRNDGSITYFDTSASTTTWSFDGSSLTGTGTYSASQFFNGNLLYTAVIQDLSIVMGGTASATSFECVEGVFGGYVGASLCGNYTFGGDYIDDSSVIYNLGGDAGSQIRVIGGDDVITDDAQQLSFYDLNGNDSYVSFPYGSAMDSWYWDGESLILEFQPGTVSRSIHMNFSVSSVPVPAAAWLFGSAVLGLAGFKRKQIKK